MDCNILEYSCAQKPQGKWILFKCLLILAYLAFTVAYFFFIVEIGFIPLGAMIPLLLWIMIYFTWRYTNPDYKYTIDAGVLTFYISYGKKTHEKFKLHIKEAIAIVPRDETPRYKAELKVKKTYNALPTKNEKDAYAIIFKKETKVCIFFLKVTRDTIKALHYYNKNTII